jgi:hypothetical protein
MKTITDLTYKVSRYIFEDDVLIQVTDEHITTPNFIIGDLNAKNSNLYENITPPEDWRGGKYKYYNDEWTLNPMWIDPETIVDRGRR